MAVSNVVKLRTKTDIAMDALRAKLQEATVEQTAEALNGALAQRAKDRLDDLKDLRATQARDHLRHAMDELVRVVGFRDAVEYVDAYFTTIVGRCGNE